ncbi:MAG: hypothetical protein IBJ15_01045 [Alphaproteobacteria bacterium]|nr:hypothetical protein [Alphaproteobacteria bacterium]
MDLSEPIRRRASAARRRPEARARGVAIFVPLGLRDLIEEIAARYREGEPLDAIFRGLVPARGAQLTVSSSQPDRGAPARAPVPELCAPAIDGSAEGLAMVSPAGTSAALPPGPPEPGEGEPLDSATIEAGSIALAAPSASPPSALPDVSEGFPALAAASSRPLEDRAAAKADEDRGPALAPAAACRKVRGARPAWVAAGGVIGVVLTVFAISLWAPAGRGQGAEIDRLKRQVRTLQDELRQAQEVTLEALDRANGVPAASSVDQLFRPLR